MYKNQRISLCLPARNEADHLARVIASVPDCIDEIIVISNNSTDDTFQVARSLGVIVAQDDRVDGGIGYGYAHISGIAMASGDIIVAADCDGSYPLADIPRLLDELSADTTDFVSANRYPVSKTVHIPWFLKIGVTLLNIETTLLYQHQIKDILSGMWAFKQSIVDDLTLTEGGWNFSPQIKLSALTNPNIKFSEVQIAQNIRYGKTHQQYLKTGLSHLWWIAKNRFSSAISTAFINYALINACCLLLEIGLLYVFASVVGLQYLLAASLAFTSSLIINYFLCRRWVFVNHFLSRQTEFLIFAGIGLVGLMVNDGSMWFFTQELQMYYMVSKLFAAGFVFIASFVARYYLLQKIPNKNVVSVPEPEY